MHIFESFAVWLIRVGSRLWEQAEAWKADWDKTLQAAKKEGQLVLYGSADFEILFAEFHKKFPEIKVTRRLWAGRRRGQEIYVGAARGKALADLYVNGMTTGYKFFIKRKRSIRSRRCWFFRK